MNDTSQAVDKPPASILRKEDLKESSGKNDYPNAKDSETPSNTCIEKSSEMNGIDQKRKDIIEERSSEELNKQINETKISEKTNRLAAENKIKKELKEIKALKTNLEKVLEKQNPTMKEEIEAEEDTYNIEALVERKGSKYLVKWENFPEDQNTWEPKSSIPAFIRKVKQLKHDFDLKS